MVISGLLAMLREQLNENEAREIAARAVGTDRHLLRLYPDRPVSEEQLGEARKMLSRRLSGEPLQYILGEWDFYGRTFRVSRGVLIPREDTETLVNALLERLGRGASVLDLCTGSGCIALTLRLEREDLCVAGADISPAALACAAENAGRLGAGEMMLMKANVLEPVPERLKGAFECVAANPPYIRSAEIPYLERELLFEPPLALDGGEDGLDFYRSIITGWADALTPGGMMAFEIGCDQAEQVRRIFEDNRFGKTEILRDTAGRDRVIIGTLTEQLS